MKRGFIVQALMILIAFTSCRTDGYRADRDTEFENGSPVTEIKITGQSSRNLTKLGKVWGYIKYYHPAVAAGEFNMDAELFRVLPRILEAANDEEANRALREWSQRFGSVKSADVPADTASLFLKPDFSWITPESLGGELSDYLLTLQKTARPDSGYYVAYTADGAPQFLHERSYPAMKNPDAGYRLLALYRFWNIGEYFNPNRLANRYSWDHLLTGNLARFVRSKEELTYQLNILNLISQGGNSQYALSEADSLISVVAGDRMLPFKLRVIGSEAVVVGYLDQPLAEKTGFKVGDVFHKVGALMVEDGVLDKGGYVSGSNGVVALHRIAGLLSRTADTLSPVDQIQEGKIRTKALPTYPVSQLNLPGKMVRPGLTAVLKRPDGILYIRLSETDVAGLTAIVEDIRAARGVVFDLRDGVAPGLLQPLCDLFYSRPEVFARQVIPVPAQPGYFVRSKEYIAGKENPEACKTPVALLVGPETAGDAESLLMALQQIPGATTVGYVTAGSQGLVSQFPMPGGFTVHLETTTVCYPDGRITQFPGIVPGYIVEPDIKSVSAGIDDDLNAAVKMIKGEQSVKRR